MTNSLSHNNNRDVDSSNSASAPITIPNNNTIKKTYRRTQHVKVSKSSNNCRQNFTKRQCLKCKESSSNVEMLKDKVCKIQELVDAIAKTAQNMANNYSQRDNQPRKWKFGGIDLTTSSLEEIQDLVLKTTSIMLPSSSSNNDAKDISNSSIEPSSSSTSVRKKTIDLSSAAPSSSSSQLITRKPLHSEPFQSIEDHRHCSPLPSHFPSNNESQALRQDSGFSDLRQNTDPKEHRNERDQRR
ncbi:4814_t:CDS:2 [Entrophospora sp. SA101]|nr:4814_t:CDS:2 [Entrophospora sp. SA101]